MDVRAQILIIINILVFVNSSPSFIHKCKNDKDLNECVLKNAGIALPVIFKGDAELGIPSFEPFKFPTIKLGSKQNIEIVFKNGEISGLNSSVIKDAQWDAGKQAVYFKLHYPSATNVFDYEMEGTFLGHKMNGHGRGSIVAKNVWYALNMTYGTEDIDGTSYPKIETMHADYSVETFTFDLKNLSDTDNTPEAELNHMLSTNWEKFNAITKQDSSEFLTQMFNLVLSAVFKKIPADKLFH